MIRRLVPAALALLAASPALAEGRFSAGITGGSLGIGPELAYRFDDMVGVRANATFLDVGAGFDVDDLRYRGDANLRSGGAMIDVFPFRGGFRLSAGARVNGNNGRVRAMARDSVTVGRMTYTPAQIGTIEGDAETRNFAPQVTIGWAGGNRSGFVFGVEAGALFQGRVRIGRFTNSTGLIRQSDLDAERADVQDEVDKYKVYPILQLTAGYRF